MIAKNEISDYDKHKNDIDKWLNIKGEVKYLEFIKFLKRIILIVIGITFQTYTNMINDYKIIFLNICLFLKNI